MVRAGARVVMFLPGGRWPRLQQGFARHARLRHTNWQVLKCSSLRHIAGHADLTLNTFTLAFGLEPPIEQPQAQIGLWGLVN